jgi:hypothetical protein
VYDVPVNLKLILFDTHIVGDKFVCQAYKVGWQIQSYFKKNCRIKKIKKNINNGVIEKYGGIHFYDKIGYYYKTIDIERVGSFYYNIQWHFWLKWDIQEY